MESAVKHNNEERKCTGWLMYKVKHRNVLFKDFIYLYLERGEGSEKDREKHQYAVASRAPHTGELTRDPGMCPDWEPNWRPFGSQAGTQSTEPHQPGQNAGMLNRKVILLIAIFVNIINICLLPFCSWLDSLFKPYWFFFNILCFYIHFF